MTKTRPASEQLRFVSASTGEHILDTYMEASEKGGRTLYDLLEDMWDPSTGDLRTDVFQFRVDGGNLQYRVGDYIDPEANWVTISGFFEITGPFNASTFYDNLDLVEVASGDIYVVTGLDTPTSYPNEAAFTTAHTLLFDLTSATEAATTAQSWATKTDGQIDATDYSAKAYAIGGTGVDDAIGSAKDWAIKTSTTVDGTNYSAKYWATQADVGTVASNIGDIITVASQIAQVQAITDVYTVSATEPATPSEGDLWHDTGTQTLKVYTGGSFQSLAALTTTDDLTEGSNLFYTDARANAAIDARVTSTYITNLGFDPQADAVAMAIALGG